MLWQEGKLSATTLPSCIDTILSSHSCLVSCLVRIQSMYSVVQCYKKGSGKIYDIFRQYPKLSEEGWGKNQEVFRPETPAQA